MGLAVKRASTQVEGRSSQGEVAAVPQPTDTVAPLAPPPAAAAPTHPLHPRLPQHLPVALLAPPPHKGRGGVVARHPARPGGAAAAIAHTGTAVRRAGTGGGAAQSGQVVTRGSAALPESTGAAGVGPDPGRGTGIEAGAGAERAAVVAETEGGTRRGKGAGSAGTAVTVGAVSTNRRLPVERETGRGGEREAEAMKKIRKRRIKTRRETVTKGKKSLNLKTRRREALLQRRTTKQRKGKRVTPLQTPRATSALG